MLLAKHWAAQLDDYVIDLAWSPDGTRLAAASASGPISLFRAEDGVRVDLPGHDGGTNALAWEPAAGRAGLLASGGQDGAVRLWDAATAQHTATAKLGNGWVEQVRWGPVLVAACGRKLAVLGSDGSLRRAFADAPKTISALAIGPAASGSLIADGHFGGVRLLDAGTGLVAKEFPYGNGIHALVWSPDGKWLVSGNQDPSVHLWIPAENAELQMSGYEAKVKHLSFDRTSRWLATSGGRDACVWDCSGPGPEGREPSMLPHDAPLTAVAFQNAHGILATASQDGAVQLWSPERQQPVRAAAKTPAASSRLAWSPDDTLLAIGSEQGAVYVLRCAD